MGPRVTATRVGLIVLAALTGALWWVVDVGAALAVQLGPLDLVLFVLAAAAMERLPIKIADGRAVPTSLAVVGAAAMLGAAPPVVAFIAAAGLAAARLVSRDRLTAAELLLRALGGWALTGVAGLGVWLGPPTWSGDVDLAAPAMLNLGAAVAVGIGMAVGSPAVESLIRLRTPWRFAARRVFEEIHRNRFVGAAIATTAALGALVHPVLGVWTLPTMLLPLIAARAGLDRLALGQQAYDQTIRAMSRLPEQLGTVEANHGVRVANLAREVALELGLGADRIAETVRAAHLHELGRIKLERESPAPQGELARAGASVLREVGELERVAAIVEAQGDLHASARDEVGLPARIIVAACEYDRYAPAPGATGQRQEVVVRLVRATGDPEVVAALGRVIDADGAVAPSAGATSG